MDGKQTELHLKTWDQLMEKIGSLKGKDISLPNHVGMAANKRAEAKAKRLAERLAMAKKKKDKEALEKSAEGQENSKTDA